MGHTCGTPEQVLATNNNQLVNNIQQIKPDIKHQQQHHSNTALKSPQSIHHESQAKAPVPDKDKKHHQNQIPSQQKTDKIKNKGIYKIFCCLNFGATPQIGQIQQDKQQKQAQIMRSSISQSKNNRQKSHTLRNKICTNCSVQNQDIESQHKEVEPTATDRKLLRKTTSNPQRQQNQAEDQSQNDDYYRQSGLSPKFCQLSDKVFEASQSNREDQISTKKQSSQNNIKLIIRAKNSSVISQYYNNSNIKLSTMEIPFEIVQLSLSKSLIEGLNTYNPQFFNKFGSNLSPRSSNWRMLQNGTYTNILENLHGIFIAKDTFYQGYFIQNSKISFSPQEKGLYINKQYMYNGDFKEGKADGHGKLICRQTKDIYQGTWYEGSLIIGTIHKQNFIYTGQLYDKEPSGLGELKIINKNVNYKGKFTSGRFQDEDAVYQCPKYWYKGGFKNGRKNGKGVLLHKINNMKIEGYWNSDRISKPAISSAKEF